MPEIGECYSIASQLKKHTGKVQKIEISDKFEKYILKGNYKISEINNSIISKIIPFGKSIWFLGDIKGKKFIITSQLGMTGSWFINDTMNERGHFHIKFLINNTWVKYSDPRMFGKMNIHFGENHDEISKMIIKKQKWGIDPIISSKEEIFNQLLKLKDKNQNIKVKLLEQNLIFGIGNYLASEILFDAKINPKTICCNLSDIEFKSIASSIKKWVTLAEKNNGFSFAGGYIMPDGSWGDLKNYIKVYQKEGMLCPNCKNKIIKEFINTRASFYCKKCQKPV